jgi:streptogramin lyase
MRASYLSGPLLLLTVLSLPVPSSITTPHATVPTSFPQTSPEQYVTFLPKVPSGNPSPLIIYPNDTTVWVVGFATGTPPTSQIREYFVNNGTSRGVLNFSNTEISAILVDRNRVWFAENSTLAFYNSTSEKPETQKTFPGQSLQSLALDHHGRLWMTLVESNGTSNIVVLNPDNTTRTYPVPTSNALAVGITVAPLPDNTIWFAEAGAKKLGHLSCDACNIAETSPAPPSINIAAPVQVTVDNSGNVWFTDHGDNQFGVFNPNTNTWKVLPIGYCQDRCTSGLPNALFLGAKNTIWFSEHIAGRIANYDSSTGILTEYIVSPNSPPYTWWAMPGTHNLVWFVAWSLGEIGYVNATLPIPFSLTSTSGDVVVQRGSYRYVPVLVASQSFGTLSFGISPVTNDQEFLQTTAQIFGSSPPDLGPGTNPLTVTFTISAAWNATLGPRYVALTASNGQVAISVHVRVVVVEASIPYITLGFSSVIILGTFTLYLRRSRKITVETVKRKRG